VTYLVTGGAGFIGSHLCEQLLREGKRVLAVDNLSTGQYRNISHLKSNANFSFFVGDIREEEFLTTLVEKCETIFHLAAAVGVRLIIERPVETIESNILGTHTVLSLAAKYHRKLLITSTSEVYGKATATPFNEEDDIILGPSNKKRWSYACSKLADEFAALAFHEEKGLPVIIVRLFNTVGPRQTSRYGMVIPTFVRQALRNEPITVFGPGTQSRCFTHVSEVVTALIRLVQAENAIGEVINIGTTQEVSIVELARMVKKITGSRSEITFIPYDEAYEKGFEDMERRIPDISKARNIIGFDPKKGLNDIIVDLVDSLK
jgi:UDP-glucose 4-epimerase